MKNRPIFQKLFASYLVFILLMMSITTFLSVNTLKNFHREQTLIDLRDQAMLIAEQIRLPFAAGEERLLRGMITTLGEKTGSRITLILANGQVLADSTENGQSLDNHADRPEFLEALAGRIGQAVRYSYSLHTSMLYVALPIGPESAPTGVVRTAKPIQSFNAALSMAYPGIIFSSLAVALAAALISFLVSRRISRPLERIKKAAEIFATGHLRKKIHIAGPAEVVALADSLNKMAARLQDRIDTVIRQRNEQEAVLSSMVEGVVAVDKEERILRLNQAGQVLLSVSDDNPQGKPIQEVVRKADMLRFIRHTLSSPEPVEGEVLIQDGTREIFFQMHGMPLKNAAGEPFGALVVLNDVSRIRRLENVRRDFVANVSHELRTPITAIKGFVETLLEGALDQPEEGRRFLRIVAKQAERLNAIIEDLLRLSRIEEDEETVSIQLEKRRLSEVLNAALVSCSALARDESVHIELQCPPELTAAVNPPLLEQAVTNLIDNAIKYSPKNGRVLVRAEENQQEVLIIVQDWGTGIAAEHLPRIFERFYRVDKARSRKLGGTGLGLAIVKHIAQIHGGTVDVVSVPGKGSTFSVRLPNPHQ
ncbi:MAG: HAMP domain-containing protein [Deltaproteobacteria bacterium]|nr:HAMP domain-containing protein [Deltaproteobacteria bacterium]